MHIKQVRQVKDITVNSYIRKLTPMISYGMELGYIEKFPYSYVKHQEVFKDIYTEEELKLLLKNLLKRILQTDLQSLEIGQ